MDSYLRSSRGFLGPGNVLLWAPLVQTIKVLIRSDQIADSTRSQIKGWLKNTSDPAVALMALTVIETLACNAPPKMRAQLAGPRWMDRFGKTLHANNSSVQVAQAQLLVDLAFLFSTDELGRAAHAVVSQAHHRWMVDSLSPSQAAWDVKSEWQLGIPAVGPYRGPDYTLSLTHRGMGASSQGSRGLDRPGSLGLNGGSGAALGLSGASSSGAALPPALTAAAAAELLRSPSSATARNALPGAGSSASASLPTGRLTPQHVQGMTAQMQAQGQDLRTHTAAARQALRALPSPQTALSAALQSSARLSGQSSGAVVPALPPTLASHVDCGFRAAERCNAWRQVVSLAVPHLDDPQAVSALLTALDAVNAALDSWQAWVSGGELFRGLGLAGDVAAQWRTSGAGPSSGQARASSTAAGRSSTTDLLVFNDEPPTMVGPLTEVSTAPSAPVLPPGATIATSANGEPAGVLDVLDQLSAGWVLPSAAPPGRNPFAVLSSGGAPPPAAFTPPPPGAAVLPGSGTGLGVLPPAPTPVAYGVGNAASGHAPSAPPVRPPQQAAQASWQRFEDTVNLLGGVTVGGGGGSTSRTSSTTPVPFPPSGPSPAAAPSPAAPSWQGVNGADNGVVNGIGASAPAPPARQLTEGEGEESSHPDWQAELSATLAQATTLQRAPVGLRMEGELRRLVSRMQSHYEAQLAATKHRAITVVRQLREDLAAAHATRHAPQHTPPVEPVPQQPSYGLQQALPIQPQSAPPQLLTAMYGGVPGVLPSNTWTQGGYPVGVGGSAPLSSTGAPYPTPLGTAQSMAAGRSGSASGPAQAWGHSDGLWPACSTGVPPGVHALPTYTHTAAASLAYPG